MAARALEYVLARIHGHALRFHVPAQGTGDGGFKFYGIGSHGRILPESGCCHSRTPAVQAGNGSGLCR